MVKIQYKYEETDDEGIFGQPETYSVYELDRVDFETRSDDQRVALIFNELYIAMILYSSIE